MVTQEQIGLIKKKARNFRHDVVDMIGYGEGKAGHLGGSCSSAEIVAALYFYKMKINLEDPKDLDRDRFLLSKGHAVLIQYAALADLGYFPKDWLKSVKKCGYPLQGHPDMTKTPGLEANTGSLGQGLSIGVGMALGLRLNLCKRKVYVVVGDGEMQEGQIWEAAMAATNYNLDNIVAFLDKNGVQATGPICEEMNIGDPTAKWEAFGWHVIKIDGHDVMQICNALDKADHIKGMPTIIIADTVKGKGILFAEGNASFHNCTLTKEQFEQAHRDIDNMFNASEE